MLAGDVERDPAGDEDGEVKARVAHVGNGGCGGGHLFEVVQYEQAAASPVRSLERFQRGAVNILAGTDGQGDCGEHKAGIANRGERIEADAAGTGERQQPSGGRSGLRDGEFLEKGC